MMSEELETELSKLRSNADNLASCLGALLKRIEELEHEGVNAGGGSSSSTIKRTEESRLSDSELTQREFITVDPVSGLKKHTLIIERIVTSRSSPSSPSADEEMNGERLLASAYEARIVRVDCADLLAKVEMEFICGEAVVMKVEPELSKLIHPGDTIVEINGQPFEHKKMLYSLNGEVDLKLVLSDIYTAPMEFAKVLEKHDCPDENIQNGESQSKPAKNLPYLSFGLKKGDVLQVLSKDKTYMQARKVNDLSKAGFVPLSIKMERVAMMCPYGRRVLLLLGANGVGRRTLKGMLLAQLPDYFTTVVPLTSRASRPGEQEGREYNFLTKEDILKKIRDGKMVEWGEHKEQLYGTSVDSVRRVMRSGRVCVLDCSSKALKCLYNREFMPYVVVIAAPSFEEMKQFCELRKEFVDENKLRSTCEHSEKLLNSDYAKYFHLVLVNRNRDMTLRRLMEALDHLKNESQWVPEDWLCQ